MEVLYPLWAVRWIPSCLQRLGGENMNISFGICVRGCLRSRTLRLAADRRCLLYKKRYPSDDAAGYKRLYDCLRV